MYRVKKAPSPLTSFRGRNIPRLPGKTRIGLICTISVLSAIAVSLLLGGTILLPHLLSHCLSKRFDLEVCIKDASLGYMGTINAEGVYITGENSHSAGRKDQ